jgi:hypothetical protein
VERKGEHHVMLNVIARTITSADRGDFTTACNACLI